MADLKLTLVVACALVDAESRGRLVDAVRETFAAMGWAVTAVVTAEEGALVTATTADGRNGQVLLRVSRPFTAEQIEALGQKLSEWLLGREVSGARWCER